MNSKEVREIIPDIEIADETLISEEEGWCRYTTIENKKEMYERGKEVMRLLKELAFG